jgi:hypothetical protein
MMKGIHYILILMTVALLSGCNIYDIDEILLERDEISLTWKGVEQIVFDPMTWQVGYNSETYEYRVHDDDMADYFVLECETRPGTEGEDITASVEWTEKDDVRRYEDILFTVKKIAPDGRVWLWSRMQKIGVVVKQLE